MVDVEMDPAPGPRTEAKVDPDQPVVTIPIHLSNGLAPHLSIHQFPLLTQLKVPATAEAAGRRIKARHKLKTGLVEVRLPLDVREEVYNVERGRTLGAAREVEEAQDAEKPRRKKKLVKDEEGIPKRLDEVRMVSQLTKPSKADSRTTNMIGVLRGDKLYLHPLERTYQLRPALDYLDILSAKAKAEAKKNRDYDEDDDEDDEEGAEKKPKAREVREVIGTAKSSGGDKDALGGLSAVRREMLNLMTADKEDKWHDLEWADQNTPRAALIYESLFPQTDTKLTCTTKLGDILRSLDGLS